MSNCEQNLKAFALFHIANGREPGQKLIICRMSFYAWEGRPWPEWEVESFAVEMEAGGRRQNEKDGPKKESQLVHEGKTPQEDKWLMIFGTLMLNMPF